MGLSNRYERREEIDVREHPGLLQWTAKDWAQAVALVVLGIIFKSILPDGAWSTLGALAFVSFFVTVWWRRRNADKPRLPKSEWTPPQPRPGSDS